MKGGLIFFLGNRDKRTVSDTVIVAMTGVLLSANFIFLFTAIVIFGREYLNDRKKAQLKRTTRVASLKKQKSAVVNTETKNPTKVLPLAALTETGINVREWKTEDHM